MTFGGRGIALRLWGVVVAGGAVAVGLSLGLSIGGAGPVNASPHPGLSAHPPTVSLVATLNDPNETIEDDFGSSVAASGSTVVVGAPGGPSNGNVYIYERGPDGWPLTPTVTLDNPADVFNFGSSVAIAGSTIVVGADGISGTNDSGGAAYVYTKGTGAWSTTPAVSLGDPGASINGGFGFAVALSGGSIAVGAPFERGSQVQPGSGATYLYVVRHGSWPSRPTKTLADPNPQAGDDYGRAVAISDGTLVVGADGREETMAPPGSAYVYRADRRAWPSLPSVTLTDPRSTSADGFGSAVALDRGTLSVGAMGALDPSYDGLAYVFVRQGTRWSTTPTAVLGREDDGPLQHYFGAAVATSQTAVVVGAPAGYAGPSAIYSYFISNGEWPTIPTVLTGNPANPLVPVYDDYGSAVALSGNIVAVGAWEANTFNGAVYLYSL